MSFLYKFNIQSHMNFKMKKNFYIPFRFNSNSIQAFNGKLRFVKFFPTRFSYCVSGENVIKLKSKDIIPFFTFLKYHTGTAYSQLMDITAVDHSERKLRFEVIYQLLSVFYNQRLSVSVCTSEGKPLESITSIYSSAGWYERETWDRYGVYFINHSDRRRRLTDYGFKGHPLRKDFPLTGYVEVRYDDSRKRIVYEKVSLSQEFRLFGLYNPWGFTSY